MTNLYREFDTHICLISYLFLFFVLISISVFNTYSFLCFPFILMLIPVLYLCPFLFFALFMMYLRAFDLFTYSKGHQNDKVCNT